MVAQFDEVRQLSEQAKDLLQKAKKYRKDAEARPDQKETFESFADELEIQAEKLAERALQMSKQR